MKKSNNIISDWLEKYGDPEIDKQVEEEIKYINRMRKYRYCKYCDRTIPPGYNLYEHIKICKNIDPSLR